MVQDELEDRDEDIIFQEIVEQCINEDIFVPGEEAVEEEAPEAIPVSQAIKAVELPKLFEL